MAQHCSGAQGARLRSIPGALVRSCSLRRGHDPARARRQTMTWLKVDDQEWMSERVAALVDLVGHDTANAVWGEVYRAAIYCMAHLSDGTIPVSAFQLIAGPSYDQHLKLARKVGYVAAGTSTNAMGGKCLTLPWLLEHNPTKEQHTTRLARRRELQDNELRDRVRRRDGDNCRYCGDWVNTNNDRKSQHARHFDHVDPAGVGFNNLVTACASCNRSKGGRTPDEAGMALLPAPATPAFGPQGRPAEISNLGSGSDRRLISDRISDGGYLPLVGTGKADSGLGSGGAAPTRRGSRGGRKHHPRPASEGTA